MSLSSPDTAPVPPVAEQPLELATARQMLDMLHGQIRSADEKIRALFSGSALFAAALALNAQQTTGSMNLANLTWVEALNLGARLLLLVTIAGSVLSAVLALLPRTVPTRSLRSLFFFGHIAATEHDAFLAEFRALTTREALDQVISQIHVNALIVRAKYVWTYRAASLFVAAILIWIVVQIIEVAF